MGYLKYHTSLKTKTWSLLKTNILQILKTWPL